MFHHEFNQLLEEAYPDGLPEDQTGLVRIYLSALADRKMVLSIMEEAQPKTIEEAATLASHHGRAEDFMKPPKSKGRTTAL